MTDRGKGRRALGKGLGALIPGAETTRPTRPNRDYFTCPIEQVHPQPDQPRQQFDQEALGGLVDSIREQGVIQPPIVRRRNGQEGFELIAGERRWRAAQLAGLKELPVVVKEASPAEAFEMALVENIQREDLNPIEEAEAFKRLIDEHSYTQSEVASRVGRDRSTVTNSLRLLGLPPDVRALVIDNLLTEGHARALLQAGTATRISILARKAIAKKWSVRETEKQARLSAQGPVTKPAANTETQSAQLRSLTEKLQRALGSKVKIADKKGKGRLEISYTSYEELDRILNKILL